MDQSAFDYPDHLPEKAPDWPPGELVRSGPGWLSLLSATSDHYAVVFLVVASGPYLAVPGEVGASAGEVDFHTGLVEFGHVTMGPASDEIALPGGGGRYRYLVFCAGRDALTKAEAEAETETETDDFPAGIERWTIFLTKS